MTEMVIIIITAGYKYQGGKEDYLILSYIVRSGRTVTGGTGRYSGRLNMKAGMVPDPALFSNRIVSRRVGHAACMGWSAWRADLVFLHELVEPRALEAGYTDSLGYVVPGEDEEVFHVLPLRLRYCFVADLQKGREPG